ncbi:F-box DNA helicase 1-like isoform X20 [Dreissena polymorpha]|uniref:F-box DNA helicase 1-like isoform X11 n=1 Tax=Dreissena polymorpha TaxID=45954 RepID=UPI0022642582|nr:F-box DNA helicase 1-like isoform X11 [Dreissena polymorpha]XP_052213567.1 F-box DNA helicase 1-like isoform X12 [Dreissena polymorpha]XP_052213568.1 F-box DNA helicase 1-like isoform X13 [Dreissena polymorpha]XP_052213569.1 F-box DNA helicase 1-like isoform X14 [Dreissena polymorpha]XP_052213570.1 F-box DNA helicase 1-like isoform X15 [Dreissena polymorpha]XP_052213571.1 F-box DNA helicase 1-like isoform X16 [Dreissena polymorpha]XP_052213572.1 F-box DNA helicase 1-like isoform X17 [Dreis
MGTSHILDLTVEYIEFLVVQFIRFCVFLISSKHETSIVANMGDKSTLEEEFGECIENVHDYSYCESVDIEIGKVHSSAAKRNSIEVARNSKRKRLHMDSSECFEQGNKSLASGSPGLSLSVNRDASRGLYPVIRNRKRKVDVHDERHNFARINTENSTFANARTGFVAASEMYNIAVNKSPIKETPDNFDNQSFRKVPKQIKQIQNQGSILNFFMQCPSKLECPSGTVFNTSTKPITQVMKDSMESTTSIDAMVPKLNIEMNNDKIPASGRSVLYSPIKKAGNDCDSTCIYISNDNIPASGKSVKYLPVNKAGNDCDSTCIDISDDKIPALGRSVMYSPIKKAGNDRDSTCIYISDDSDSNSRFSSQGTNKTLQNPKSDVVKQLFNAQRSLLKDPKHKSKGKKQTSKSFTSISKTEIESVKNEAAKYFLGDSFDMNSVFNSESDVEGTLSPIPQSNVKTKVLPKAVISDKYGLLGTGNYPRDVDEKINYFEHLPPEVVENIFCQLPMLDLCLNSNRVCLQWNQIIGSEKFVPWKKLYHKLKADHGTSRVEVRQMMVKYGMKFPSNYLAALIRYMKDFKPVTAANMLECLSKHRRYSLAGQLIDERLEDCKTHGAPNPWCVISLLVILAHSVEEIQEIIGCLSCSVSQCTSLEILECLYCISTFLFAFKLAQKGQIWSGMHYRLYYALYLYENASCSSAGDLQSIMGQNKGGQQSLMKYSSSSDSVRLTHEQMRIVKYMARPEEVIKIVAFAGTGKTTTLVRYTQLRPGKKFLLVVYNKSVCDYAKTKFPPNVECRTGHSLAFGAVGRRYTKKLGNLKVYTLTQTLRARKGENLFLQAKFVLSTLEAFFASADDHISVSHVPSTKLNEKTGQKEQIDIQTKQNLVSDANIIWAKMKDFNENSVFMTHDGYLKLYQLSRPRLSKYDCILIDEAQDLTPAITDILLGQPQGKILVGDPHQQIYSFRGAVNAMEMIQADTVFYLTQSFRFGPEIAHVAMSCLEVLKKETKKTLVGSGKKSTVDGTSLGQVAIISRCNFTVFSEAVKKCCYTQEECKVAFVGGTDNFGFPMLMDMYSLLCPQNGSKEGYEIKNKFIKMFPNFKELEKFAVKSMDVELQGKIKIVKTYHTNLPILIRKIDSKCVKDERTADYVFSTAHKAKGLEFSTVRLTDDFMAGDQQSMFVTLQNLGLDMEDDEREERGMQDVIAVRADKQISEDENNLLYVAVTRAKNALQMSKTLMSVLKLAGEQFVYPVASDKLRESGQVFRCRGTHAEFKPHCVTLQKKEITLGDGVLLKGGLYSPACT